MDAETFRRFGYQAVDWVADYMKRVEQLPVLPSVAPGDISRQLPDTAPEAGEPMEQMLADFEKIILPGVTHWNHPRFFAYFPANHSGPAILAEILSAGLGINGMVWQSCPAATELEEKMMEWLRRLLGLPESFKGTIQDTASTATLCALICARERLTEFATNAKGLQDQSGAGKLRIYTSEEAHSSIEKGVKIVGLGAENLVSVAVDSDRAMQPGDLEYKIHADLAQGHRPCAVVATVGTTSSTAIDPLRPLGEIADRFGLWLHVDAALAGSAAILPEKKWLIDGVEKAHSFVFNPHKWLFTNFDCSAFFCREPDTLIRSLTILPEYLKTSHDQQVTNYRDWGIQLGRRFRALKLWFVLRWFGAQGLRERLRAHLQMAQDFKTWVEEAPDFEILAPVPLQTICFRFNPSGTNAGNPPDEEELDVWNKDLLDAVNATGEVFMTHTRLENRFCLRLSVGQIQTQSKDVEHAWKLLQKSARKIYRSA